MALTIDRRGFLSISFAAAAALKGAEPRASFPAAPRERLSVSTYPFRGVIGRGQSGGQSANKNATSTTDAGAARMSLAEFAASIRDRFQVGGIEPWSHHFESVEPDYVAELARAFAKAGVRVVNIPCDVRVQLCGTPEELALALDTYSKWVDAAVLLGSPSIRVHVPQMSTDNVRCAVDGLSVLAAYGEKNNVVINLENDNPKTENPYQVLKVIETANTPFLRALPDFCNSRQLGDEQYNEHALEALFPHAYNISHVKDMEIVGGKTLRTDVGKIFAIAKKAGYRGYFSMEWEAAGGDPYEGTKQLIEASLKGLA